MVEWRCWWCVGTRRAQARGGTGGAALAAQGDGDRAGRRDALSEVDLAMGEAHCVERRAYGGADGMSCTNDDRGVRGGRYGIHEGGRSGGQAWYGATSYIRAARVASGYRDPWPPLPDMHCVHSGAARPIRSEPYRSDSVSSTKKTGLHRGTGQPCALRGSEVAIRVTTGYVSCHLRGKYQRAQRCGGQ